MYCCNRQVKKKENGHSILVVNLQDRQNLFRGFLTLKESWRSLKNLVASFKNHEICSVYHRQINLDYLRRGGEAEQNTERAQDRSVEVVNRPSSPLRYGLNPSVW